MYEEELILYMEVDETWSVDYFKFYGKNTIIDLSSDISRFLYITRYGFIDDVTLISHGISTTGYICIASGAYTSYFNRITYHKESDDKVINNIIIYLNTSGIVITNPTFSEGSVYAVESYMEIVNSSFSNALYGIITYYEYTNISRVNFTGIEEYCIYCKGGLIYVIDCCYEGELIYHTDEGNVLLVNNVNLTEQSFSSESLEDNSSHESIDEQNSKSSLFDTISESSYVYEHSSSSSQTISESDSNVYDQDYDKI